MRFVFLFVFFFVGLCAGDVPGALPESIRSEIRNFYIKNAPANCDLGKDCIEENADIISSYYVDLVKLIPVKKEGGEGIFDRALSDIKWWIKSGSGNHYVKGELLRGYIKTKNDSLRMAFSEGYLSDEISGNILASYKKTILRMIGKIESRLFSYDIYMDKSMVPASVLNIAMDATVGGRTPSSDLVRFARDAYIDLCFKSFSINRVNEMDVISKNIFHGSSWVSGFRYDDEISNEEIDAVVNAIFLSRLNGDSVVKFDCPVKFYVYKMMDECEMIIKRNK